MPTLSDKLKRQIEILGLCLQTPEGLSKADLEIEFTRDSPTIARDLRDLRSFGVDIHSTKRGITIYNPIKAETIRSLIVQYIGISQSSVTYDRSTAFLVRRFKEKALIHIVTLQRCIENGCKALIDYEKTPGNIEKDRVIAPLLLFQAEQEWRLLAENEEVRKQFIVSKMKRVRQTKDTFTKPPQDELHGLITSSWGGWLGGPLLSVKIEFAPHWAERVAHRQFTANQKITRRSDGSAILEAEVNGMAEIAAWIVSRGKGVRVLEPNALRLQVIELAKDSLSNYKHR